MVLPKTILCEKCGAEAHVLTREVDDKEVYGKLTADDPRRRDGFTFRIDCPQCGQRDQYLAPQP